MAAQVNTKLNVGGAQYIYDMFYLYGFTSAFFVYSLLSHFYPAAGTIIPATINEEVEVIGGIEYRNDGLSTPVEANAGSDVGDEKAVMKSAEYNV